MLLLPPFALIALGLFIAFVLGESVPLILVSSRRWWIFFRWYVCVCYVCAELEKTTATAAETHRNGYATDAYKRSTERKRAGDPRMGEERHMMTPTPLQITERKRVGITSSRPHSRKI